MIRFITADVFTDRAFEGNPLAVFPNAEGLSATQMQIIARELNLSESVFLFPPDSASATRRLRIFTPGMELPFAGHPTIGTAIVLASEGMVELEGNDTSIVLEENVGPVAVLLRQEGDRITATLSAAQMPEYGPPPPPRDVIAQLLRLDVADIADAPAAPAAVSCGVPFLFIGVRDRETLSRAALDREVWNTHFRDSWAPHIYVVSESTSGPDLHARMFAPAMNIVEDPATGAAATAIAGWLEPPAPEEDRDRHFTIEQGRDMGRPSTIHVAAEIRGGYITAIHVSGTAVVVGRGEIRVP